MYKTAECVIFVCFCNDSFSVCHIATLLYGLGLGKKVLFASLINVREDMQITLYSILRMTMTLSR